MVELWLAGDAVPAIYVAQIAPHQRHLGRAGLALALLVVLVVALFAAAIWFRKNTSRIARRVSRVAERIGSSEPLRRLHQHSPRVWEFLIRRFKSGEYLGLHLTLGLIVSMAAIWLFAGVTEDVINRDPLTQLDIGLLEWLHSHSTPGGVQLFLAISWLGSPLVMTTIGLMVAARLALRRSWLLFWGWVAAFAGAGALDTLLKHIIRRPRPPYAAALLHDSSFSFPSGHAMGSLIGYGIFVYLLVTLWPQRRRVRLVIYSFASLLILAIGISRLYLGVHYFSDVVGGYAAGCVWLSACITGIEVARRQPKGR